MGIGHGGLFGDTGRGNGGVPKASVMSGAQWGRGRMLLGVSTREVRAARWGRGAPALLQPRPSPCWRRATCSGGMEAGGEDNQGRQSLYCRRVYF